MSVPRLWKIRPVEPRQLTPREKQVVDLVGQARSNKQIAYELGISFDTVRNHLRAIFKKLGVADRLNLLLYALRSQAQARERSINPIQEGQHDTDRM